MSDRIKHDPTLSMPQDGQRIDRPVIIVHQVAGNRTQYLVFLQEIDPSLSDPRAAGIILSDLVDHIARGYHDVTGNDERLIRESIYKVMRDEERFKQRDPARGGSTGRTEIPRRN